MTIDIDDIEARITEAEAQSPAGFELLGIYLETEEARVLCAEVRELRAAIAAQDKRIETSGLRVGLFYGTDTPEYMADSIEELRAALGRLQGEVETIINIYPHDPNCSITVGACNCWQAWLERALAGETK